MSEGCLLKIKKEKIWKRKCIEVFLGFRFFLIGFDAQSKKKSWKKRAELCQFIYFWIQIPQNRSLICWHFLITDQYGFTWFNYFWNMQKLLWQHIIIWDHSSAVTGEVGTETLQVLSCTLFPWCQHTQLLKRFTDHIYLCEVSISLESCIEQPGRLQ